MVLTWEASRAARTPDGEGRGLDVQVCDLEGGTYSLWTSISTTALFSA